MKPGKMKNKQMPSGPKGLASVSMLAAHSMNNPATTQQSMNANRLVPPHRPMGPSGQAVMEVNDVMPGIPLDTEGTKSTMRARKRLLT